jgi:hypothetical protein
MMQYGRVEVVSSRWVGSKTSGDHVASDTSIEIADASDFQEAGDRIKIDDSIYHVEVVDFNDIEDEPDTIHITPGLTGDVDSGTDVLLQPLTSEKVALIQLDGRDDADEVVVPAFLQNRLQDGIRGAEDQETALLDIIEEQITIVDILGLGEDNGDIKAVDDFAVCTGSGDQVIQLSYVPLLDENDPDSTRQKSIHVYWGAAFQWDDQWSYDETNNQVVMPDPYGRLLSGRRLYAKYLARERWFASTNALNFDCDTTVDLPLGDFIMLRRVSSFTTWGRFADGVICPNPAAIAEAGADWADYYHPELTLDPTKYYQIQVTFDPTSTHDDGNRDVYVTSARPGFEITDFDSSYSSFPGHMPWANLHDARPRYIDGNVTTFIIGPGMAGWDDPTWGPGAGFTRAVVETEGGAVSAISVRKVCNWTEDEIHWQLDTGLGGATLVGPDVETALSDANAATYIQIPHTASTPVGPSLRWVPVDLTAYPWRRMWLEFDVEVVGGGSAQLNWTFDFPYNNDGSTTVPYDDSGQLWHTPMTVNTGTYVQHVPLEIPELDSFTGDSGEFSHFTIAKTVVAASHSTFPTPHYIGLTWTVYVGENSKDVRITRCVLKVSRPEGT